MGAEFSPESIRPRLAQVQERIGAAARRSGRNPEQVRLVVVTKTHPVETVAALVEAGAGLLGEKIYLGESYVDEAVPKSIALLKILSSEAESGVEFHMIGHVQSRKARLVCEHFNYLHSLDSLKLARRLDRFSQELGQSLPVLLECNPSGEESKFGFPAWDENRWDELIPSIDEILALPGLQVRGLMGMAPFAEDPQAARPYFNRLRRLRDHLARRFPALGWDELSMGMSGDYETAIEEGATWVRIGSAILSRNG